MIRQFHNVLLVGFVTYFGTAQNNFQAGALAFKQTNQLCGLKHIPNVNTETDDLCLTWALFAQGVQQLQYHVWQWLRQGEFKQCCLICQRLATVTRHVGHQIAQAQRRVDVLRVQSAKDDGGLRGHRVRHVQIILRKQKLSAQAQSEISCILSPFSSRHCWLPLKLGVTRC